MVKIAKSKWEQVKDKLILIEGWARDGLVDEQIAKNLDIALSTFYEYKNKYLEFSDALKRGKEVVDYEVENALLKSAINGNVTAQIFWLKNRKPKEWKDKRDIDILEGAISLSEAIQKAYENKAGDK